MKTHLTRISVYAVASAIALLSVYPFYWMCVSAFRTQDAILSTPTRILPESLDLTALRSISSLGGTPLWTYVFNSVFITIAATVIGVCATGAGAYALYRNPRLPLFAGVRYSFLLTIMYPNMMLVIPLYFVVFQLGLLGSYTGIILCTSAQRFRRVAETVSGGGAILDRPQRHSRRPCIFML